jgi:hypothetical protein
VEACLLCGFVFLWQLLCSRLVAHLVSDFTFSVIFSCLIGGLACSCIHLGPYDWLFAKFTDLGLF